MLIYIGRMGKCLLEQSNRTKAKLADLLLQVRFKADHASYFFMMIVALWPPKPNEFDIAISNIRFTRRVRHIIQITFRILIVQIDRRRNDAIRDR